MHCNNSCLNLISCPECIISLLVGTVVAQKGEIYSF